MAVKASGRSSRNVVQLVRPTLRETIARLAPGTALRDGLERILRGRTGALIVIGYDDSVESICDGGFELDVRYAPTRLRELSKMDGAVVLSTDGGRILRANVQLVPDPSIPTEESGTRHRSAERTAIQTGYPVISVSHSMSIVTVYVAGERHVIPDSATILSRANQTIDTLERYKTRLDEVSRQLSTAEIEDFVTLRDVMTVVQRLEMVRRISLEIDSYVVELGTDGRQLKLQLEELVGDNDTARELIVRDYHASPDAPSAAQVSATLDELDSLSDNELLDFTTLARVFGYPSTAEAQDSAMSSRGYRAMAGIPRLQFAHVDLLVRSFGSLQGLLAATSDDLQSVEGIGSMWARHIREGLSQLAESTIADRLAQFAPFRCGSFVVGAVAEQLPCEPTRFCSSCVHEPLHGPHRIWLRRAPLNDGVVHILCYADRHHSGLVDLVQRAIEAIVLDEDIGIADLDRKVVHDAADLLEYRVHRLLTLVAVLDAQDASALVPQGGEHLSVPVDGARHLDHRLLLELIDQVAALDAGQLPLCFHLGAVQLFPSFHLDPVQGLGQRQFACRALLGGHQLQA